MTGFELRTSGIGSERSTTESQPLPKLIKMFIQRINEWKGLLSRLRTGEGNIGWEFRGVKGGISIQFSLTGYS